MVTLTKNQTLMDFLEGVQSYPLHDSADAVDLVPDHSIEYLNRFPGGQGILFEAHMSHIFNEVAKNHPSIFIDPIPKGVQTTCDWPFHFSYTYNRLHQQTLCASQRTREQIVPQQFAEYDLVLLADDLPVIVECKSSCPNTNESMKGRSESHVRRISRPIIEYFGTDEIGFVQITGRPDELRESYDFGLTQRGGVCIVWSYNGADLVEELSYHSNV